MPELIIPLEGGLNLQDDPTACPPGTCRNALNFEVTQQAGYSLRKGWTGYDGTIIGAELEDFLYIHYTSGWNAVSAIYGEQIVLTVGGVSVNVICVGWQNLGSGTGVLVVANTIGGTAYNTLSQRISTATAGTLSGFGLTGNWVIQQAGFYTNSGDIFVGGIGLTPSSYSYILQQVIAGLQSALPVPGNPLSGLDAGFLLADNTYTIHDCIVFAFNSGTDANARLLEGHVIKSVGGATTYGTVLNVVLVAGDWPSGTATGYVVVYDVPLSTVYPANNTQMNVYTADGVTSLGNIFKYTSAGSLAAYPATSRALMYKTADQTTGRTTAFAGWTRVPLTREIQYSQAYSGQPTGIGFGPVGGAPFSVYEYSRQGLTTTLATLTPINSGPTAGTPGYYGCTTAFQGGALWTNLNNIKIDDGANATAVIGIGGFNRQFNALGFTLSDVPLNAAILGVTVQVHWNATTAGNRIMDYQVNLIKPDGTLTVGRESNTFVPVAPTYFTYGGPNDVWGYGWKQSEVTNANFGVRFNCRNNGGAIDTANIDFVGVQVTYLPPSRIVYIRNSLAAAPTDVPAFIVHYTTDNNTQFASSNAVGTLTIAGTGLESAFTAAGKSRTVGAGEQIRDAPGGVGNLLGWTTSTDLPTSFPCGAALNANGSRWEWNCYNFYADPNAQIALGANGVEYGIGFDGTYTIRTKTGRRQDLDNPRHVIGYNGNVHWGYNSGDILVSAPGRPFTVAGLQLSQAYNISQPIAGMAELAGQILAVFGTRTVYGLEGTDPLNYTRRTLSPSLGAFEYTVANVEGSVMWTSFRGIETMRTTNAYGEFETVPLSQASTPWLQPRLQGDSRVAIVNQRPVYALAVRNKRQYRLFFADGYTFSLTLFGPQNIPMGMPGQYVDGGGNVIVPRHVFQGIRSDGKEILYACWDKVNNQNTVSGIPTLGKLDVGVFEFSGAVITAGFIELNPVYPAAQNNKIDITTQCQYQDMSLFVSSMTGTGYYLSIYSMAGDDLPMSLGNYSAVPTTATRSQLDLGPNQNILFLPLPVLNYGCNISAYGRMIRFRIDTIAAPIAPLRMVRIQSNYDTDMQERN